MSKVTITGKKILFFSPAFFNYENMIAEKMREMGAEVDMYDERSVTKAFDRALLKISSDFFKKKSLLYYEKIIEENRGKNYDYIFIIKCDMTPVSILKRFRIEFPNAKLCLYLWDSLENIPGVVKKLKYFDTLHSFDFDDCKTHSVLEFRPLFFGEQFQKKEHTNGYKYDLSFCGTIHSDRYAVIKQIQKMAKKEGLKCYWFLYLQSTFIFYFYKAVKREFYGVSKSEFSFTKKSAAEIAEIVKDSKIILDIQHPRQTGLTMRTIEMIGMNKKVITTNKNVMQYDFFDKNNVLVVDRRNVVIPKDFWRTPYKPLKEEVYEKYTLKSWILEVLN